jgi:L-iditol 2-dehydrogenase
MEPLAAVLRGVNAIELGEGDTVVVCGAGPIGLLAVILARQLGAGRIIVSQTSAARRALAVEFGADVAIDPRADDLVTRVRQETDGVGADCVIVATPAPVVYGQAVQMAAIGGRVNYFAGLPSGRGEVTIDANLVHYRELRVTGSTANTTEDCIDALAILAREPDVYSRLVTSRFPLADGVEAFAASADGSELKVVVEP